VIRTDKDWYILSFAWKWAHEKRVVTHALPDFPSYSRDKECDKQLVEKLWELMDEADIIIAHNGDAFDAKKANARFVVHGLRPPSPVKTIDTLKIARRHFKFSSNRLNDLGGYLNLGKKLPHTGAHLWFGCMAGDEKSWRIMRKYNAQDVTLLCRVYERLKPWAANHPNLTIWNDIEGCPVCQSRRVQRRGVMVKVAAKRHRYQCNDCGHWFSGKKIDVPNKASGRGRRRCGGNHSHVQPRNRRVAQAQRART
jgi:DNA polymerase elongation subunit (family B)